MFDLEGNERDSLEAGQEGIICLTKTPFYAESGGQVGDAGVIETSDKLFNVSDTQLSGDQHLHIGKVSSGLFKPGESVMAEINVSKRDLARKNERTRL